MSSGVYTLLDNVAVTGPSVTIGFAGRHLWEVIGNFSAGTVTLDILGPDGLTWSTIKNSLGVAVSDTAPDTDYVHLPAGAIVRATVTGGTPSGLRARLRYAGT